MIKSQCSTTSTRWLSRPPLGDEVYPLLQWQITTRGARRVEDVTTKLGQPVQQLVGPGVETIFQRNHPGILKSLEDVRGEGVM